MKFINLLSLLCVFPWFSSSLMIDDGIDKRSEIESRLNSSFSKLLFELNQFDYSQTIVRYVKPNGETRTILPKKPQNKLLPISKIQPSNKKVGIPLSPGAILNLSIEFINSLQHHIVSILYEKFKSFTLPMEVEVPGVTISHFHVDLEDLKVENLNLYLSESDNSIVLGFSGLNMDASADIKINKFMIKESGSFNVKLMLKQLIVKAIFVEEKSKQLMVPQVSVKLVDLDIPSDEMDIKLKLKYIPSVLSNFIMGFIKGTLIDKIKSFLSDFIPGDGTSKANDLFKQDYPEEIPLIENQLLLSILLTSPVKVNSDRLMINIDALAYAKAKGKGTREFPSHMAFTNDDGNDIIFGVSQEMIDSVVKSFVTDINNNTYVKEFGNFKAEFQTNIDLNTFVIWESGMKFQKVLVNGQISYLGFTFDIHFLMDFSFEIEEIDFINKQFFVTIKKVELSDYTFKSNIPVIESFGIYLKGFIEAFGILVKHYSIPCPALMLPYDVAVDKVDFRFENGFMVVKIDTEIKE
jgi:hypothetical protein